MAHLVGTRVELVELKSAAMNHRCGQCTSFDEESERCMVKLDGTEEKFVKVKPDNLRSIDEDAPTYRFAWNKSGTLLCAEHRAEVCGSCCADYGLLNSMKRSTSHLDDARLEKMMNVYFKLPVAIKSNRESISTYSDHLSGDLTALLEKGSYEGHGIVNICASITYLARFQSIGRPKLIPLLSACVDHLHDIRNEQNAREEWLTAVKDDKLDRQREQEPTKSRFVPGKKYARPPPDQLQCGKSPVEDMLSLLFEKGVRQFGSFFEDYEIHGEGLRLATSQLQGWGKGKDPNEQIPIDDQMRCSLTRARDAMEFFAKLGEAVPLDDPRDWKEHRVKAFLLEHRIEPKPLPPKKVLVKTARKLIEAKKHAMYMINCMPDDDEAARMSERMDEKGDGWLSDEEAASVLVVSHIIKDFDLSLLEAWPQSRALTPVVMQEFLGNAMSNRKQRLAEASNKDLVFCLQRNLIVMAQSLDEAFAADKIPPTIFVQPENSDEQLACVAMEVLKVLEMPSEQGKHPLPALVVKFHHARRNWMTPARQDDFYKGLQRPSLLMQNIPASLDEVDFLHQLLKSNRKQLIQPLVAAAEREWPPGWRYSVLVLEASFGEKRCALCGSRARKYCSGCKVEAYCGSACQKTHWKTHKQFCSRQRSVSVSSPSSSCATSSTAASP